MAGRTSDRARDRSGQRRQATAGLRAERRAALSAAAAGEDEAPLWRRSRDGDREARRLLVERYLPYARVVAARLYGRRPHDDVEFEEYRQLAHVGLLEAIDRYQADRGARFTTFATLRIRGAVLSGLERLTERRQQWAARHRNLEERVETLVDLRDPSLGARILEDLEEIGLEMALGLILERSPSEGDLPEVAYAQREIQRAHQRLWERVKYLTPRERQVVEQHYGEGKRFEAIARDLELTRGRISQLHQQALQRLRTLVRRQDGFDVAY